MRLKTTLAALVLVALPSLAIAACGGDHVKQSASPCPQGMVLDNATGSCVKLTSS